MRVSSDDEVYRVDNVWLGPVGVPMAREIVQFFHARYAAYVIFAAWFVAVMLVLQQLGFAGGWSVVWGAIAAGGLTRLVGSKVTHERPVGAVVAMFRHELAAPRRSTAVRGLVSAPRRRRWLIRRRKQLRKLTEQEDSEQS